MAQGVDVGMKIGIRAVDAGKPTVSVSWWDGADTSWRLSVGCANCGIFTFVLSICNGVSEGTSNSCWSDANCSASVLSSMGLASCLQVLKWLKAAGLQSMLPAFLRDIQAATHHCVMEAHTGSMRLSTALLSCLV